jgi:hypothetical protein
MFNWMKRKLRQWVFENEANKLGRAEATVDPDNVQSGDFRIAVKRAINGKVLEISTYNPNPRGSSWTTDLFVVPQDESLKDALTMLLLLKGLEK